MLACTYETCGDLLIPAERKRTEELMQKVISGYCHGRLMGKTGNRFFHEHIWQFTVLCFVQECLVIFDKCPEAKEFLRYFYELWTSRAPVTGFNRDGTWQNGQLLQLECCLFDVSAQTVQLCRRDGLPPSSVVSECGERGGLHLDSRFAQFWFR